MGWERAPSWRRRASPRPASGAGGARFMRQGVDGLLRDKTRPPGIAPLDRKIVETIVALTLATPPHEATHWTLRAMAKAAHVAASTVQKVWRDHGLAPHRWRAFKLSKDPAFAEKCTILLVFMSRLRPTPW